MKNKQYHYHKQVNCRCIAIYKETQDALRFMYQIMNIEDSKKRLETIITPSKEIQQVLAITRYKLP